MALAPARTKYRKSQKGSRSGNAKRGNTLAFGEYGLQSLSRGPMTGQQIEDYLASGEWQGKAGGYAIQGRAEQYIRFLSGSHSNVVGLPLFETAQLLRGIGWLRP